MSVRGRAGTYVIAKRLAMGGQGSVYEVRGGTHVVKLYHNWPAEKRALQITRLERLIRDGAPSRSFVWPEDIVEGPSLGYVMPYVKGWIPIEQLATTAYIGKTNLRTRARIGYFLATAFSYLHLKRGAAYCDLSGSNVLCNPDQGDVRLIDVDNLYLEGTLAPTGIRGTPRYMAPELQAGVAPHPSVETDLHALAVLLYQLFVFHHPLLGDRIHADADLEDEALGLGATYVESATKRSNKYTFGYGGIPIGTMPVELQQQFRGAFEDGLHAPTRRPGVTGWRRVLLRLLDSLVPCNNRDCWMGHVPMPFSSGGVCPDRCPWCQHRLGGPVFAAILGQRPVVGSPQKVLQEGTTFTRHHVHTGALFDVGGDAAIGRIEKDAKHGGLVWRNLLQEEIRVTTIGNASEAVCPPGKGVRLLPGVRIQFVRDWASITVVQLL